MTAPDYPDLVRRLRVASCSNSWSPEYEALLMEGSAAIEGLLKRAALWESDARTFKASWDQACNELGECQAERDALKRDAERYRWVREFRPSRRIFVVEADSTFGDEILRDDRLDAAIDAALAKERTHE